MNARRLTILAAMAFCAVFTTPADDSWVVREDGADPVRVGMTLAQLNAVLHEKFLKPAAKNDQACFYVDPKGKPKISLMIEDGRLARVDVNGSGIFTSTGLQVGDTEKHALQVYGRRLKTEPHKYIDNGHYLTAKSNNELYGIRFETEDEKNTSSYAGRYRAIQYVEGCE